MSWVVGVDVGGTFTDFFAHNSRTGSVHLHKVPSTPNNPAEAIVEGLQDLCRREAIPVSEIIRLAHGTTVATNALIQGRGGKVALITTKGFRDLIEIGRQVRPKLFDFQADYPPPLVRRQHRFEVEERITAGGKILLPLSHDEIERVVAAIAELAPDACAICLLFSFINPRHEVQLRNALEQALPNIALSISSEVQPEFREYERLSTTVLNARLTPVMGRYLAALEERMNRLAPAAAIGINQSSGGLMSVERARRFPIRTALSGPAAGVIGAIDVAQRSGHPDIITLDMGGTSADVALVNNYRAGTVFDKWVQGFPTRLASIDINAVGAGGGSVAWFDRDGLLKVGPVSAGADPGPACYGRGGAEPTVSDANLVLGRLSETGLIGGAMTLNTEAAHNALQPLAERLGYTIEHTALGIIGIVVANMVRALRTVSVERGHDPRGFVLMPFGGAGPLHASEVARSLGMTRVLVPRNPGILCAQGLLVSDLQENFVRTVVSPVNDDTHDLLLQTVKDLRAEADAWFTTESIAPIKREARLTLDMRYIGQNFELPVALPGGTDDPLPGPMELASLFFRAHDQNYGFFNPDDSIEVVNVRLAARGRQRRTDPRPVASTSEPARPSLARPVWFTSDRPTETPVFRRDRLLPAQTITGPAVIEQLDATTLLLPGDRASIDADLNLIVDILP